MKIWKLFSLASLIGLTITLSIGREIHSPEAAGGFAVCHDQPNMANALATLKSARASLEKAENNKGGWRVAAIEATNKAIAETERGCAFAGTH